MKPPVNPVTISYRLTRGIWHNLKVADPAHHTRPEFNVPTQDARWFRLCTVDGVTVTTADGCGVVYRQRDRAKMFSLLFKSLRRQRRLAKRFDEMRRRYRDALPVLSSKQKWETALLPAAARRQTKSRNMPEAPPSEAPRGEVAAMVAIQSALADRPGVLTAARGLSHFGEHSIGWVAVSLLGAVVVPQRRREWLVAGAGAFAAHAAAVLIKRVVRRKRPHHPAIAVNVGTPSQLSFPSAHATSTTAAAILMGRATGLPGARGTGAADGAVANLGGGALSQRRRRRDCSRRRGRGHRMQAGPRAEQGPR